MSEIQNLGVFEQIENLEYADPYQARIAQQARDLEIFLNDVQNEPHTTELQRLEAQDIAYEWIRMMNDECPHIGQPIVVTGEVTESFYDIFEEKYKAGDTLYTRQAVWSAGYTTYSDITDSDQYRMRVGHLFNLGNQPAVTHEDASLVRLTPTLHAFASIGAVDIEAPTVTQGQGDERLKYEVPELLEAFNEHTADTDDACAALYNLSSMSVSAKYDIPADTLRRFEVYAYSQLGFDTVLPYSLSLRGLAAVYPRDGTSTLSVAKYFEEETQLCVTPQRLALCSIPILTKDGRVGITSAKHWALVVRSFGVEYDDNDNYYVVPISTMVGMQPLRQDLCRPDVPKVNSSAGAAEEYSI